MAPIATTTQDIAADTIQAAKTALSMSASTSKTTTSHPLDPLSGDEIKTAVEIIKSHVQQVDSEAKIWFKHVTLHEPPKVELVKYLLATRKRSATEGLPREAAALISRTTSGGVKYYEYIVSLTSNSVVSCQVVADLDHAPLDADEMVAAEEALLQDPEFAKVVEKLRLPEGAVVVADSWPYGCDTVDEVPRLIPMMTYYRTSSDLDSNHYATPLPLIPVMNPATMKLHSVEYTPIYGGESTETIETLWSKGENFPWEKHQPHEYKHDLQASIRGGLEPLEVVQKNGPSFKVDGRKVEWQKWEFVVGFNYREGLTLHDIRYDGRDLFHRLSISDMTVPYGDSRTPYHRKQAFDLGDVGAGVCANQLDLGCDCLGSIHYFSADMVTSKGDVKRMNNVVCLHEQDEGIGWKHTNFRTGNASVTRSRVLVIQMIITVANYDYIFAWKLDQAANIHLETRATGILSTVAIIPGETSPYGTIVNPGVLAPNHQHIFSVRMDPAIGGLGEGNTVVQEDSVPMAYDPKNPPKNNPWGVGYTVEKTPMEKSGFANAAPHKNRVFKIINPSRTNPISGRNIGYKLIPQPSQLMLSHPESVGFARAEFADHHIWVTKYKDGELFSGGQYTNQSSGNARGIKSWVARQDNVANDDLVLWHTFGLTHNTRVEDFPVMPCETHTISLKPVDFFTASPAIDVPPSTQAFNKSTLVNGSCGSCH
ncbi:hypothetical protein I204_00732 [Kwoniella mangroviensis CBS 8886]|uniref:uncharacterized protein n=1 Tax=Kwoniella mangroviensis CBS 8507 TaxID=1296122 RepID=UPI00080D0D32|nr:uncharacterized protein I203_07020 [Kwoniella mangroviensis CBS 8507]OCF63701.1 hypothetical protein I203_07020 [Kwoniella mangroviensis CBS 8507]OCF78788.1 hypothetical protein I204_00732 [Kwoniella mangroviensis CBS 8886]